MVHGPRFADLPVELNNIDVTRVPKTRKRHRVYSEARRAYLRMILFACRGVVMEPLMILARIVRTA